MSAMCINGDNSIWLKTRAGKPFKKSTHFKMYDQQVKGGYSSLLLCSYENSSGLLSPALGPAI